MKATILAISDSDKHFADASKEYEKRLESHVYIQLIKPYKHKSIDMVISKETESIQEILDKKFSHYHKVLLSIQGQEMHSQEFSQWCHKRSEIVFIIGGPYGLDRAKMQNSINQEISLGPLTLPHGLAKLVLLEQLYRAITIHEGKKYHY